MASFCDSGQSQSQQNNQQWVNPLGPSGLMFNGSNFAPVFSPTTAPQQGQQVLNYLQGQQPQIAQAGVTAGNAATTAASNPGYGTASTLANNTMLGDYLGGSPQLTAAMNQNTTQALNASANQNARDASTYAENGLDYSTAHDQANQANTAAAASGAANTNAQTYLQNYLAQTGYQQNAVNNLNSATAAPLNYLNQVSTSETQPLSQMANILSGISGGGQINTTGGSSTGTNAPSMASNIMNGTSAGIGAAGAGAAMGM